jgi:hypothetical protein
MTCCGLSILRLGLAICLGWAIQGKAAVEMRNTDMW